MTKSKVKVLNKLKGSSLGLYDSNDAGFSTVKAYKVIDITSYCKVENLEQVIIKYAKVKRGTIAQLSYGSNSCSTFVHYHINEFTRKSLAQDIVFQQRGNILQIPSLTLSNLIYSNALE